MKIQALIAAAVGSFLSACSSGTVQNSSTAGVSPPGCTALETRPASSPTQTPAFAGQNRACGIRSNMQLDVTVVASGLDHPWAVEPLPGGDLLVTERPGRLRIISASGTIGQPITGLPAVDARGQGGLLDVALSPSFASDRMVYWSYSEPGEGGNTTAVARGVLSADRGSVGNVSVIFRVVPRYNGTMHFGSRLDWGADGKLFIGTGERSNTEMRPYAQSLQSHLGKVLRINPDGSTPADNPFVGRADALPQIYSLGHRNIQAASVDPQGRLWVIEHGTNGGDELNLIEGGKNYGWPQQAYGIEYSGGAIAGAQTSREGTQQPVYYWDPVIAPSGAQWYTGDAFAAWKGDLLIGALKEKRLVRLVVANGRVTGEEHLLTDRGQRIRDVRQGPDGFVYIVTDESNGQLWRVAPRK